MNDRLPLDDALADRFFERQRREIVLRILSERSVGRRRYALSALAASVLFAIGVAYGVLDSGPSQPDEQFFATLWDLPAIAAIPDDDPLAVFGRWDDPDGDVTGFLEELSVTAPNSAAFDAPVFPLDMDFGELAPQPLGAEHDQKG